VTTRTRQHLLQQSVPYPTVALSQLTVFIVCRLLNEEIDQPDERLGVDLEQ
jgi:hypothetical protein